MVPTKSTWRPCSCSGVRASHALSSPQAATGMPAAANSAALTTKARSALSSVALRTKLEVVVASRAAAMGARAGGGSALSATKPGAPLSVRCKSS